jgi:hypothetical protein
VLGCGLPSLIFLKDKSKAMKIGIVDKENDILMVKYGVAVDAKTSLVVINKASSLTHEDQSPLVGISEDSN